MTVTPLDALPLAQLWERTSAKWRSYPEDVLPLFVAETDFALAPAVGRALARAVERGDTGYLQKSSGIREAYASFAGRRYGWEVDPADVRTTGDVMVGVVELLRATIAPGDRVFITTPVYPPFFRCIPEVGGVVEEIPLIRDDRGYRLDLASIEAAFAAGAKALLLCNPHNPTGTVHSREDLAEVARIARAHDAHVISDEIHAPLGTRTIRSSPSCPSRTTRAPWGSPSPARRRRSTSPVSSARSPSCRGRSRAAS